MSSVYYCVRVSPGGDCKWLKTGQVRSVRIRLEHTWLANLRKPYASETDTKSYYGKSQVAQIIMHLTQMSALWCNYRAVTGRVTI